MTTDHILYQLDNINKLAFDQNEDRIHPPTPASTRPCLEPYAHIILKYMLPQKNHERFDA
jgi:hypothetical protein